MTKKCKRCGRELIYPHNLGGSTYGRVCVELAGKGEKLPVQVDFENFPPPTINLTTLRVEQHLRDLNLPVDSVKVNYDPEQYYTAYDGSYAPAAATYDIQTSKITFYPATGGSSAEELLAVLSHELGHQVWYESLADKQKEFWKDIYKRLKRTGRFITEYASTDVYEFFAECVAAYVHDAGTLKFVHPKVYMWLKDNLFGGREFNESKNI